jgi:hypothetical protein
MKIIPTYVLIALLGASFWSMLAAVGLIPAVAELTGLHYSTWVVPAVFGVSLAGTLLTLLFLGGASVNSRQIDETR